jgi:hypothetical protein
LFVNEPLQLNEIGFGKHWDSIIQPMLPYLLCYAASLNTQIIPNENV